MEDETLELSEDVIAQAAEVYATFDRNGSNTVSSSELGNMLNALGLFFPLGDNVDLITFKNKKKKFSRMIKKRNLSTVG